MEVHLRELENQVHAGSQGVGEADLQCARGLIAYALGDLDAAQEHLTAAVKAPALLEEAYETLGMLEQQRLDWEKSIEWSTEGIRRDAGYISFYLARGFSWAYWATDLSQRGDNPERMLESAVADFTRAIEIRPEDAGPWTRRGHALLTWGNHVGSRGDDATKLYERALGDFEVACKKQPEDDEPYRKCGVVRINMARDLMKRGGDPTKLIEGALEDFDRALQCNPDEHENWLRKARAFDALADYRRGKGEDPTELYDKAVSSYEEALKRNPKRPGVWLSFSETLLSLAGVRSRGGEIDVAGFERALRCNQEAIDRDDGRLLDHPWRNRGTIYMAWAAQEERRGRSPIERVEKAVEEFREGLRHNEGSYDCRLGLGEALVALSRRAEKPMDLLNEAVAVLEKAARNRTKDERAWVALGNTHLARVSCLRARGADPTAAAKAALSSYAEAVQVNAGLSGTLRQRMAACEDVLRSRP